MRGTTADVFAIVEAAYRVEATDADWLEGIGAACCPELDVGFGLCAFEYQHAAGQAPRILQARMMNMPEALAKVYPTVYAKMDPEVRALPFSHGPCTTASQMLGLRDDFKKNELMQRFAQTFGIYDSIWVTALEPSGWGCGLHAGRPRIEWASRAKVGRWSRIAGHLAAAARLRRRWKEREAVAGAKPVEEAVFSSDGHLHHAEGPAKSTQAVRALRHAVLAVEDIRSGKSEGGEDAGLESWKALVAGRWSLIDRFEKDSRRYIVAYENEPRPPDFEVLTSRERQVVGYAALGHDNKVIAYDMGISHSTVRVLVARAASKMGAASRADLIAAYRARCRRADTAAATQARDEVPVPSSRTGPSSEHRREAT